MKPGIYDDITNTDYHADKTAMSSTDAKTLARPGGIGVWIAGREQRKDSAVLQFGSAAHAWVLERVRPEVWEKTLTLTSKAAQARLAELEGSDKLLVTRADWETIQAMRGQLFDHPQAAKLLNDKSGRAERSIFWEDKETGACLKCRPDWLIPPSESRPAIIVDYKTTKDASPQGFARSCASFGYDQQAAWYIDGVKSVYPDSGEPEFWFVAQEKTGPHLVGAYQINPADVRAARRLNRAAISIWLSVKDLDGRTPFARMLTGEGYGSSELSMPRWRQSEIDDATYAGSIDTVTVPF